MTLLQAVAVMWLLILMLQTRGIYWNKNLCLPPERTRRVCSAVMLHSLEMTVLLSVWKQYSVFSLAVWPIWPSFPICSHDTSENLFPQSFRYSKTFFSPNKMRWEFVSHQTRQCHYSFTGLCSFCMSISNNQLLFSLFTLLYFSIVAMTTQSRTFKISQLPKISIYF